MQEVELWACLDESGDYTVGKDQESAAEAYENDIGSTGIGIRFVKLLVKVPLPTTIALRGEAPAEPTPAAELKVV